MYTVEPPIRDTEIGTTSLQGTKLLAPKCPSFGDSTVQSDLCLLPTPPSVFPLLLVFSVKL